MVGGTPKPFACTRVGCSMTFITEDHLNVHQKKHEMDLDLSLGNKTNVFVADQTPTPTRFLRNCEEVGLFQDLQNVNPFEETFRRAVELVKGGSLPEPEINTDDTLHTPHVFPLLSEDSIYSTKKCTTETTLPSVQIIDDENLPNKTLDINNITNEEIFENDKSEKNNNQDKTKTVTNKDHDYALDTYKNDKTKNKTKVKLKQAIKNKKRSPQMRQAIETIYLPPTTLRPVSLTTLLLPTNANIIPLTTNIKPSIKNVENLINKRDTLSEKVKLRQKSSKEQLLERNRAAASRCRKKKKQYIDTLQIEFEQICAQNNELQEEISNLKSENAQLKSLLLAHKDCPVTKAMTQTKADLMPYGLIKVNVNAPKQTKNRLVLPKTDIPQIKIQRLSSPQTTVESVALLTPVKKSVIVIPKNNTLT